MASTKPSREELRQKHHAEAAEVHNGATKTKAPGSHAGHHGLEMVLDILIVVASFMLLKKSGCTNASTCSDPRIVKVVDLVFMLFNGVTIIGLAYLTCHAKKKGVEKDASALQTRLIKAVAKAVVLWAMHVSMGTMFPIFSGIMLALIALPFWNDQDHYYINVYGRDYLGYDTSPVTCCGAPHETHAGHVELCLEFALLIGAILAFQLTNCTNVKTCDNPKMITYAVIFFFVFNGLFLCCQLKLMIKAKNCETEEGLADAKKIKTKMVLTIVKAGVFFSLHHFLGLMAPLIASCLMAIIKLPVFSAYDQSLWAKYSGAQGREYMPL